MMKLAVCLILADSSLIKKRVILYDKIFIFLSNINTNSTRPNLTESDQH